MTKTLKSVEGAYDRVAPLYNLMNGLYFFGRDHQFRSTLIQKLALDANSAVLNVCCGTGLDFSIILQELGKNGTIVGVDLSTQMLHQAKKKDSDTLALVRADIAHLPFREKKFDAIVITFCLKITPTLSLSITEFARVLKNTGKLGVLANHKPHNVITNIFAKIIGVMAKIDFERNLEEHLFKSFIISHSQLMYDDFVKMLIGDLR
ncbi:MAG: class I SAM-dependent methyltransferase [Candidatus Bathyarchaeota archaeon]|nr:class I SAM-dependent methyltransferase [Candidatus Bathyarchaeota archaeon]